LAGGGFCYPYGRYDAIFEWKCDCDLKITSLAGSGKDLPLGTGSSYPIQGAFATSSSNPVTWTLILPDGATTSGTASGSSEINATWYGNKAGNTLATPGTYYATLTVTSSTDSTCTATEKLPIHVVPAPGEQCGFLLSFGSSAHLASGNLSYSQELLSSRGSALLLGLSLYYNSLDPVNGSLGRGWSHDYDTSLKENADGTVLISEGNWHYQYFTLHGGVYVPQTGNYSTLVKNSNGSFTLTSREGQVTSFSNAGRLVSLGDRNGNTQKFSYSGNNLSSVTDQSGRTAVFSYNSANHLTSITDPSGNVYALAVGDTLSSVTLPDGGTWRFVYDNNAFMLTKTDPLGHGTSYSYDDRHRVIGSRDPEGRTRSISYPQTTDTVKNTTFIEKDGGAWSYSYDTQKGVLLSRTDPQGGTSSYGYDANGNRTSTTNPDGTSSSSVFDSQGNMTSMTDALGQTTNYTYNGFGQITSIADSQGTTSYAYDTRGNMTSLTDPAGGATSFGYDSKGNITRITTPLGQSSTLSYDAQGNLATISDPSGATTGYSYDANGNVTAITDPKGAVTRLIHDNRNRVIKAIDPNGNALTSRYDLGGNRLSETDAHGNTTKYEYNSRNQVVKNIDALGNATLFGYSGTGCGSCGGGGIDKLTSITDANSNLTGYEYDQLGRVVRETDPLGTVTGYTYDARGNLAGKTDSNGNTIAYSYDANNRLLKKSYPDGTAETFTYDARGNILGASNKNIGYSFSYDVNDRMLGSTDSNNRTLRYEYDLAGNRTALITPAGERITYRYDDTNRLTAIVSSGGTFGIAYDSLGRRTKLAYPNGSITSYRYDAAGHLVKLDHNNRHGRTIGSFAYTLDKVGNRLSRAEPGRVTSYGYDAIYRLLFAQQSRHHESRDNEQYGYDPVGNRLIGPDARTNYIYGAGNQLLKRDGTSFIYDKNGNLIERSQGNDRHDHHGHHGKPWKYTFDYENRLVEAKNGAITVSFAYDPFGRRIEKKVEINGRREQGHDVEGGVTRYLYDGLDVVQEISQGHHRATHLQTTSYLHGPNIDEPLAAESDHKSWYYLADGLGSVVALTDRHGNVVQEYDYDSFGNLRQRGEDINQPFTYTGREWDSETGLYYYRARYYDPSLGRFIQKDPISFAGGDVNVYSYVGANPVNTVDPLGLYGSNVHYDLTKQLAIDSGFCENSAQTIAAADQGVDDSFWTGPITGIPFFSAFHFRSRKYASTGLRLAIDSGDIIQFGKFLHIFQDTYSHKGYFYPIGHAIHSLRGRDPDTYNYNTARDAAMTLNTRFYLDMFQKRNGKCGCK
jgi:RHS repeat-associated protein